MAIEDLPIIRACEINEQSKIVDKAEICYNPWYTNQSCSEFKITELWFVLGKSKQGDIFVLNEYGYSHDGVHICYKYHSYLYGEKTKPHPIYRVIGGKGIQRYISLHGK